MYVYRADTYCDSCGERIMRELTTGGDAPADPEDHYAYDSDDFPKWAREEETDGPDHCAAAGDCLEAVDLAEYGFPLDRPASEVLVGAETRTVGALLSDGLTEHGVAYLREMLAEDPRTPYQEALHAYWREVFADELAEGVAA